MSATNLSAVARCIYRSDRSPEVTEMEKYMKKFLLATVGLVALGMAAPASAADLAARPYTKAPRPMVAPIYDWSGFYIGANGGWGQERRCFNAVDITGVFIGSEGCHAAGGGGVGGPIGSRLQTGGWGFGLEAPGDWANLRGEKLSPLFPGVVNQAQT